MESSQLRNAESLDERDQLIAALTEQLEYAAEQLDRYQRAGSSPATSSRNASPFASSDLTDGLTRFLEQWDQMQAGCTLGQIEVQLEEIKGMLASTTHASLDHAPSSITSQLGSSGPSSNSTPADAFSNWESLKSSLLGEMSPSHSEQEHLDVHTEGTLSAPLSHVSTPRDPAQSAIDILGLELPPLLDFETANEDEIIDAIQQRDEVISRLLDKVNELHDIGRAGYDLDSLTTADANLHIIHELEDRLREQLKVAELKNSIERARLSREENKLQQKQTMIEKKMLQLGLEQEKDSELQATAKGKKQKQDPKRGFFSKK